MKLNSYSSSTKMKNQIQKNHLFYNTFNALYFLILFHPIFSLTIINQERASPVNEPVCIYTCTTVCSGM